MDSKYRILMTGLLNVVSVGLGLGSLILPNWIEQDHFGDHTNQGLTVTCTRYFKWYQPLGLYPSIYNWYINLLKKVNPTLPNPIPSKVNRTK